MYPDEVNQFLSQFATGIAAPEAHRRFLGWLKGATVSEFNAIADKYDLLFNWSSGAPPPCVEWIDKLERRLDKVTQGQNQTLHSRA